MGKTVNDQLFIFAGKRVGPGGTFKTFIPVGQNYHLTPGKIIDVHTWDNLKLIEFLPYTDHFHSLDMLKGV